MSRSALLNLLLVVAVLCSGCDPSEQALHAVDRDELTPVDGTTWIRTEGVGSAAVTELLVVDAESPESWSEGDRRISRAWIDYEGDVEIQVGVMRPIGVGEGDLVFTRRYLFAMESEVPFLQRIGAYREEIEDPAKVSISFVAEESTLAVTIGAAGMSYANLVDVIASIEASSGLDSQDGAEAVASLIGLGFYTSQARVPGFGAAQFNGEVGYPTFDVASLVVSDGPMGDGFQWRGSGAVSSTLTFDYYNHEDQHGIELDGARAHVVELPSYDGLMRGQVAFRLQTSKYSHNPRIQGTIDLEGLVTAASYIVGGTATVGIGGNAWVVGSDALVHIDLSAFTP